MKSNRIITGSLWAAIALGVFLGGCFVYINDGEGHNLRGEAKRTDELTAPLTDITTMEVSSQVGTVRVEAADVTEAAITAKITIRAKSDEEAEGLLDSVRIATDPSGRTLVIKAVKPDDLGHNTLAVDFTIRVPRQTDVRCDTHVGDIHIAGTAGAIVARTHVGKIECADLHGGKADLSTHVGEIKATYADDAPAALQVNAETHVGNIQFNGPEHISAHFSASTHVGGIDTKRQMTVQGFVNKSLEGTLESGEGQVSFRTNVGDIHIR
jgi:DUF4097 and DUF4098 domain-containing protein YvlB